MNLLYSKLTSICLSSNSFEDSRNVANNSPRPIKNISFNLFNSTNRLYFSTINDQTFFKKKKYIFNLSKLSKKQN